MSRMQIAQRYYGYDPETSPQLELQRAEDWLQRFAWKVDYLTRTIDGIEDNEVYEVGECSDDNGNIRHRPIDRITAKQVWIAETRLYRARRLPRQELESGEVWRDNRDFYFGRHLRPKLEEKLDAATSHHEAAEDHLSHIQLRILLDDIVLPESILEEIERVVASFQPQRTLEKVNWAAEGF